MLTATPRQVRGNAEGAVPSPDGSLIAFHSSKGEPQISVVDTNGENVRVLATAAVEENFGRIQWSPDGKKLAFIVFRVGNPEATIETLDLAGGKRAELTRQPHLRTFVWLSDGRIVFTASNPNDPSGGALHVLNGSREHRRVEIGAGLSVAQMSATLDGKRLAIIRANKQADVYSAKLARDGSLGEPRRLTLDDRDDRPTGWMPDGDTVLFESNRNGSWDVFRQRLESAAADPVAAGTGDQFGGQSVPGGNAVLYWSATSGSDLRLMSVPAMGGPSNLVFQASRNSEFRCAARPAPKQPACILAEFDGQKMSVAGFDWTTGSKATPQPLPVQAAPGERAVWALSPDGQSLAVAVNNTVHVIKVGGGESWSAAGSSLPGTVSGITFRDSGDLVVSTASARESAVLLVDQHGARKIWTSPRHVFSPVVSGDAQHLLLGITSENSNSWLVENF